ncbi:MAG: hypothetical protein IH931_02440 [candidate division Zixibacteria bacterium]|nr:hypothetical protein [candidate division Zixibacteria bacterium]
MGNRYDIFVLVLVLIFGAQTFATSSLVPPPNIRITNIPQLNNEEQVFICPTDSNIIIANWRDFRLGKRQVGIGRSTDGGQTWTDSLISVVHQVFFGDSKQSDPTMTVDRLGNFYMSVLDWDAFGFTGGSYIAFYKSTDKGVSWTGPVLHLSVINTNVFEDKQFITTDRTNGVHDGNLYCAWARFNSNPGSGPNRMAFVRSIDGGASFEDTIIVGPPQTSTGCGPSGISAGQFPIPVVTSNGDVHVLWAGSVLDSGAACTGFQAVKHVVSTDGGQSFSAESVVSPVFGWMIASNGTNTYPQPATDADITGGPFDGFMYTAFTNIGSEDISRSDVDFVLTTDNGATWSERIKINDDANSHLNESYHPWLIVNEEGVIIVIFYDTRFDSPNYFLFDLMAAYSFDGGETFTTNHRISSVSSSTNDLKKSTAYDLNEINKPESNTPVLSSSRAGLIGEYIGVTAFHDKINAVWTDSRDGNSEVYTANWYLPILEPRLLSPDDDSYANTNPTFKWATAWKSDQDSYRLEIADDSNFTSMLSTYISDSNFVLPVIDLLEGDYFWRVKSLTTAGTDSSEYSVVRSLTIDRTPPDAVSLLIPANGTTIVDSTPEFDWSDVTKGAPVLYDLYLSLDSNFPGGAGTTVYSDITESQFTPPNPIQPDTVTYWRVVSRDLAGNNSTSETFSLRYITFFCGDANNDQSEIPNILDLTFLVDYIFRGGPLPDIPAAADLDGSGGNPNIIDLTAMVDYIFRGGAQPTCGT